MKANLTSNGGGGFNLGKNSVNVKRRKFDEFAINSTEKAQSVNFKRKKYNFTFSSSIPQTSNIPTANPFSHSLEHGGKKCCHKCKRNNTVSPSRYSSIANNRS
jgi:hypothetical protein